MKFITALAFLFYITSLAFGADSYQVNFGTNSTVNEHGECRKVINNSVTGLDVYVPTKTAQEWADFRNNLPTGIKVCHCNSQVVGDFCWHMGAVGESCTTVCGNVSLTLDLTNTTSYAGSGGSNANCEAIMDAHAMPDDDTTDTVNNACGCQYKTNGSTQRLRGTQATTAACSNANWQRACICDY